MDIVDMMQCPVEIDGDKTYRYVLVVLDVFSRFILQSKSSTEVATHAIQILVMLVLPGLSKRTKELNLRDFWKR